MSWTYPTVSFNVCAMPVYMINNGISTQAGNLAIVTDSAGNVNTAHSVFWDMNGNPYVPTINSASGSPTAGGTLDFTVTVNGVAYHFADGVAAAGLTPTSYYFDGEMASFKDSQTAWHAGHGTNTKRKVA